ncbi:sugar-binding transcriptional regulator [Streptococcus parasanguinis]|uniref:sugar-binding transcriptional regulator n=1 Tax=Streptococcus parasanguinis TaxID=1318 RepID=UPI0039C46F41
MKYERKKLLAKLAYLYYIEEKSQSEIATETGIYRTTVSRMLTEAKKEGIVKIEIENFDSKLFRLENYVKEKYNLHELEIVPNIADESLKDLEQRLAQSIASMVRSLLQDGMNIGFSWGKSLSLLVDCIGSKRLENVYFYPLAGGPSHIHARYHVNTLIYNMASKFHGECRFINATIIQENKELAEGILTSKYFDDLRDSWENLDIAVVGIGSPADTHNPQWFDMLTEKDFTELRSEAAVGEVCCRFFDQEGKPVYQDLQERTVAIRLEELKQIPKTVSLAYGERKAGAILSVIKAGYINHLVTDEATIIKMLELDGDANFLE